MNVSKNDGRRAWHARVTEYTRSRCPRAVGAATKGADMSYIHFSRSIAILAGAFAALSTATPGIAGCNSGNTNSTNVLSSSGCQANASGLYATAVGLNALASGHRSTALGTISVASQEHSTAVGTLSGVYPVSSGPGFTAIGAFAGSHGAGSWSVAIGATSDFSFATEARGAGSVAIGGGSSLDFPGARAAGNAAVAVGNSSVASGEGYASAFGYNSRADVGLAPTAVGTDSTAKGTNAAAFGRFSSATAENGTALGSGAQAKRKGAVAIGFGSIADAPNTVSVGTITARRRIVNLAQGVANTDAVNLGQVKNIAAAAAIEALANETIAKAVGDTVSNDLQRELRQMKNMIDLLQQEIAELKSQNTAALAK